MDVLSNFVDLFLHLDKHLQQFQSDYGGWLYLILFVVIFAETGLVVTPFLPGDSLLFAVGALAASWFDATMAFLLLTAAAIIGNTTNYWIGKFFGPRMVAAGNGRWIKKQHLERTHAFFEKYGGKTIVISRFVPIIRTIAPFVAGIGAMTHWRFQAYNVAGGVAWVAVCVFAGRAFGEREFVKNNFSIVAIAIVVISLLPAVFEYVMHKRRKAAEGGDASA